MAKSENGAIARNASFASFPAMKVAWFGGARSRRLGRRFALLLSAILAAISRDACGLQTATLAWDPGDSSVAGYVVYTGASSGNYSARMVVGTNTTFNVTGLQEGRTNYFTVTAYNAAGVESPHASEIRYIVPGLLKLKPTSTPGAPRSFALSVASGHHYNIQATQDFKTWTTIARTGVLSSNTWWSFSDPASATMPYRFYRLIFDPVPSLQMQPSLTKGSGMIIRFAVAQGHWYEVQATQDFKTWVTISSTSTFPANGWSQFTDPASKVLHSRFYRVVPH